MSKKLLPALITFILAAAILVLNFAPSIKFPVPSISEQQPQCSPRNHLVLSCDGCTDKGVLAIGFPFRTNLYDYCKQDEAQIQWIVGLNIVVSVFLLATTYLLLKTKLSKK